MLKEAGCAAAAVVLLAAFTAGCAKKEQGEEELQKKHDWAIETMTVGKPTPPAAKPLPEDQVVVVPDSVRKKYKAVVMAVGERKTEKVTKFTVELGARADVPGTGYSVEVFEYLPAWSLHGKTVTTKGEEPMDPAVRAKIYKGAEKVFDGFIFQKHKTPSFITEEHVIGLVDVVKR